MFRKIILSFFPEEEKQSALSPLQFHLKMISSKLFYWLSMKSSLTNRRSIFTDARFTYFFPADILLKDFNTENFFYSYKNFALLNGFDNYSINVILPVVTLIAYARYFDLLPEKKFISYLRALLFSIHYVLLLFFWHFKEYDLSLTKSERLKFMLSLMDEIIFYLEFTKDNKKDYNLAKNISRNIIKILWKDEDFVMFLYNLTEKLSYLNSEKLKWMIHYYEYLVTWNLMDFPNEAEFKWILDTTTKKVFVKRYSLYLDADIITLCNVIWWEPAHINYLIDPRNYDFLPYFVDALNYIYEIDLTRNISEIVDKVLDFKKLWEGLIQSLKNFNIDFVDIAIWPDMDLKQVQEMLSKSALDSVKKVSAINEQFLDFFVLLISKKFNNEGDKYQFEAIDNIKIHVKPTKFLKKISEDEARKLKVNFMMLDKNYFIQSYFYKNKKKIEKPKSFYFWYDKVWLNFILEQSYKILLEEFSKKTHKEFIQSKNYILLLKKYFENDIKYYLDDKNIVGYLKNVISNDIKLDNKNLNFSNFKQNIYYPDFLIFNQFLKNFEVKDILRYIPSLALIKKSLFWFLIAKNLFKNSILLEQFYYSAINFYFEEQEKSYFDIISELENKYKEYINFFTKVKQNKEYVNLIESLILNIPDFYKKWFVLDSLIDITYYNKRIIKI